MSDRKFSWYTIVHPDYEGWPAPPLFRLVGPAIEQSGEVTCDIYYKPNRKGGHRHNHFSNRWVLGYYRSKRLRKGLRKCRAALLASFIKSFAKRHGGI